MSALDRHECPECGHSHRRRTEKTATAKRSQAANTDLQPGRCRECKAVIITGRINGLDTQLEPQPLNALGWQTYTGIGRGLYLRRGLRARFAPPTHRWPPPDGQQFFTTHICGKPIPEPLYSNNVTASKETVDEFPDTPPY